MEHSADLVFDQGAFDRGEIFHCAVDYAGTLNRPAADELAPGSQSRTSTVTLASGVHQLAHQPRPD